MRAPAKVDEFSLLVKGERLVICQPVFDMLDLVLLIQDLFL